MLTINKEHYKKVFILEDEEYRTKFFQEILGDIPYFITSYSDVAIKALRETKFDLIFLDHDLGNGRGNGFDVAKEIPNTINKETPIVVHSMNVSGAENIVSVNPLYTTYIPFHILVVNFKEKK